jgi:hypothetical protein
LMTTRMVFMPSVMFLAILGTTAMRV